MDTKIVLYYEFQFISGTFVSLIDLYFNLKHYHNNIKFVLFLKPEYKNIFKNSLSQYSYIPFTIVENISEIFTILKNDNIFITVMEMVNKKYFSLFSKYKSILLDSACCFLYKNDIIYIQKLKQFKHCYYLFNPWLYKYFNLNNQYVYYHKFSIERLEHLKNIQYSNKELERNHTNYSTSATNCICHKFDTLKYKRYHVYSKNNNIIYENIGKLIFEYNYLSKKVLYSPENKSFDDGLTEYLRLFNIDDSIEQEIKIDKNDIVDKLTMKHDDLILKIIEDYSHEGFNK